MDDKEERELAVNVALALKELEFLKQKLENLENATKEEKKELLETIKKLTDEIHKVKDSEAEEALKSKKYWLRVLAQVILTASLTFIVTFIFSCIFNNEQNVKSFENGYRQAILDFKNEGK